MKCDKCGNEATVHEVTIRSGKKVERHLCESCAKGEGLPVQSSHASITQVLSHYMAQQSAAGVLVPSGGVVERPKITQCPTCGTTYAQFRHDGLLGCPDCYTAFEVQLGPLLERAHEGGTHHVGKTPRRCGGAPLGLPAARMERPGALPPHPGAGSASSPAASAEEQESERARRAEMLRRRLAEAVASEQYEVAAKIRDELRRLGEATIVTPAAAVKKPGTGGKGGAKGAGGGAAGGPLA